MLPYSTSNIFRKQCCSYNLSYEEEGMHWKNNRSLKVASTFIFEGNQEIASSWMTYCEDSKGSSWWTILMFTILYIISARSVNCGGIELFKHQTTAELSTFTFNLLSTKSPPVIEVKILNETSTWHNKSGKTHLQKTVVIYLRRKTKRERKKESLHFFFFFCASTF
jgi:hypothetical protein